MAATNVGVTAVTTITADDWATWKSFVQYISAVLPTSVTTTQFGDQANSPTLAAMTAAIAGDLGVIAADVVYVNPETL